jgi:LysM repeat protein
MRLMNWLFVFILAAILLGCRPEEAVLEASPVPSATATPLVGVSLATRAVPTTAVIQTTATPLPTPTVTPTATPIIYLIADGDTLLGIAIQHGTTTEAIQALNPDVRPELLQIGQAVVLPPVEPLLVQGVVGTAVPIQVEVSQINSYQTPIGNLWLLGEVVNLGDLPVADVRLAIGLMDASGVEVGTVAAWAATPLIMPGQAAPFGVLVNEPPAGFEQPVVTVAGGESVADLGTQYVDLVVVDTAVVPQNDRVQVAGQVQNSGQTAAQAITITATFYDSQGQVIGYQQQPLPDVLAPAQSQSFTLTAAPPGGQTVNVSITAHAQAVSE